MKRFTTVSLLLAGLIATCTARNTEVDTNWDRGSSPSSSEESSESMPSIRQLEIACYEKTGSNQTFEAITASFATIPICYRKTFDVINLKDDLRQLNAFTRHVFFPKYCPQIRNALSCFEPSMKQLRKCLDDDIFQLRKLNATSEVLDLVCEDDGEILFRDEADYEVCMHNIFNYKETCTVLVSESTKIMAISKYGETQCGEFAKVRDCMSKRFNECNGSSLIDLMDVYLRAMFKDSPCRNLTAIGVGSGGARNPHELVWHSLRICLILFFYMLLICIQQSTIDVT